MHSFTNQPCIAATDLHHLLHQPNKKIVLIDVRSEEEYNALHIPGAVNIPLQHLTNNIEIINTATQVITVCGKSGGRSAEAATLLRQMGFANTTFLCGGTFGWQ